MSAWDELRDYEAAQNTAHHQADDATVGTADQAIKFAISGKCEDADTFLRAWKRGDLKEWPEFIAALREDAPPEIDRMIHKSMSKDFERRGEAMREDR